MKIGKRLACDKCGRIESPTLEVLPHPTEIDKHLCEVCKVDLHYDQISTTALKSDNRQML